MRSIPLTCLLCLVSACPTPNAPEIMPDASVETDAGSDGLSDGGHSLADAGHALDSGWVNPCPETATIEVTGRSIEWQWWLGDEPPNELVRISVSDPACEQLVVSSDANWLRASANLDLSALVLALEPDNVRSGDHRATVSVRTDPDRPVAATFTVHLRA